MIKIKLIHFSESVTPSNAFQVLYHIIVSKLPRTLKIILKIFFFSTVVKWKWFVSLNQDCLNIVRAYFHTERENKMKQNKTSSLLHFNELQNIQYFYSETMKILIIENL